MKQLHSMLLMLIVSISYGQPAKTDPYFVQSYDTISKFGPGCITRYILEDKKGNIWLASWQGIVKYDGKVFTNYTLKDHLIPFHVYSIYEDRSGNVWFGTVRGGAYKYDGRSFTLFTSESGLPNDLIGCIMEDKKGNMWFGTDEGISCFDTSATRVASAKATFVTLTGLPLSSKKGFTNYTTANGLCGDRVNSIIQDKSGKFWIATRSGVSNYDARLTDGVGQGKSFTHFTINQSTPFTNVRCIKEDRNGKIWIGGQEGLYCYDPSATSEAALTKVMPNFIGYIYEDKAGNLWLNAGEVKGMALYKYNGKNFTKIIEKNKDGDSQVFEITEDRNGNIWFGTMNGPCRYDPRVGISPYSNSEVPAKAFTYFRR
jgi:ligand-binding sensor domain-containing protein